MTQSKVQPHHQQRQAVVYIRQSSLRQVQQNKESQHRQYQLTQRAQALGWPEARCVVIDDDLGISGAHSANRPGYQRLISMLALREVGLILGLEVSRLARNNVDWYQLLELASAFDVLIADEEGIYDPSDFNDRLLLGLKGTLSEVELFQIRARLQRGRLNKAQRGELISSLPIGFDHQQETNTIVLSADQGVRHGVAEVFRWFRQLRSVRAVLNRLHQAQLELPHQTRRRHIGRQIDWQPPSYDALYGILTNPCYAGVYCDGRRQRQRDPLTHQEHVVRRTRDQWDVFIAEHHPGYITLDEFEQNQQTLANNCSHLPHPGAPRRGPALLQGIVHCQHCARRMRICYHHGAPYYTCDAEHRRYASAICNRASAKRVDALVEELFLNLINTETIELAWSHQDQLQREADALNQRWQDKLQRLEYQADLARRRYEKVDPCNRLVAQTLEDNWNQCLEALKQAQQDYQRQSVTPQAITSTFEQMKKLIEKLPQLWHSDNVGNTDKKELIRCVVERVLLENHGKVIRAQVHWYGGAISELDVPKYLFSAPHIYHRIRELAVSHTDKEIAERLNQEGISTVKGRPWNVRRVMDFRLSNSIPSGFTSQLELRITDSGYMTSAEAAQRLQVSQGTIQKWYRAGVLAGKHDGNQAHLWIDWTTELETRLSGTATPDPRMVSVRRLCQQKNKKAEEILAWAQQQGHTIYRLRRGSAWRFYVLPADPSASHL